MKDKRKNARDKELNECCGLPTGWYILTRKHGPVRGVFIAPSRHERGLLRGDQELNECCGLPAGWYILTREGVIE